MESILRGLQSALAGRYTVEHELGRGGMATVFLGRDLKLDRRVAIKVFERETTGIVAAGDRFLREIRIAAQLQHPNILPVFESGEGDGLIYYIMPYVAGASLRERIEREGPLPLADAIRIAREVAEALDHAHRAGIVHRDIKPDNIMLADGVAVVADFGIARAFAESEAKITDTGMALGTPTYMSPEQATGTGQLDGRTDIYSLGCVLYEMLTGAPPFIAATGQGVMARHAADPVPLVSTVRQISPEVEQVIQRALAKAPADRWNSARTLAEALGGALSGSGVHRPAANRQRRWLAAALIIPVIVGGSAAWNAIRASRTADDVSAIQTLAVLPFSYSGDSTYADWADGMTESLITNLWHGGLRVLPMTRVAKYRDRAPEPMEIGRALGVHAIMTAGLRINKNRLRVVATLINASNGEMLWTDNFDGELLVKGELRDQFSMQDSMAVKILAALQPRLSRSRLADVQRGVRTRSPAALKLYLQAQSMSTFSSNELSAKRAGLLRHAIELDSTFSDAWSDLARTLDQLHISDGSPPIEAGPEVRRLVERAIAIDSTNADAYMLRGRFKWFYDWDWDAATRDMKHAFDLASGSPEVASQYAWILTFSGMNDSALALSRRMLDSTSGESWMSLGARFLHGGMPDSAVYAAERGVAADTSILNLLLVAYLVQGRRADADRIASRLLARGLNDQPRIIVDMAVYYTWIRNAKGAKAMLDSLERIRQTRYVPPSILASVRMMTGDRAGAISALEEAVRVHDRELIVFLPDVYPFLRGVPSVEAIKTRVYQSRHLPPPWPPTPASVRAAKR